MQQFNLLSLLPMLPWEGPPLPKILGFFWPWLKLSGGLAFPGVQQPFRFPLAPTSPTPSAVTTFENFEEVELLDLDKELLMPRKIVIRRKAKGNR